MNAATIRKEGIGKRGAGRRPDAEKRGGRAGKNPWGPPAAEAEYGAGGRDGRADSQEALLKTIFFTMDSRAVKGAIGRLGKDKLLKMLEMDVEGLRRVREGAPSMAESGEEIIRKAIIALGGAELPGLKGLIPTERRRELWGRVKRHTYREKQKRWREEHPFGYGTGPSDSPKPAPAGEAGGGQRKGQGGGGAVRSFLPRAGAKSFFRATMESNIADMEKRAGVLRREIARGEERIEELRRVQANSYVRGGSRFGAWLRRLLDEEPPGRAAEGGGIARGRGRESAAMKYDRARWEIALIKLSLRKKKDELSGLGRKMEGERITCGVYEAYAEKRKREVEKKKEAMCLSGVRGDAGKRWLHSLVWEIKRAEEALSNDLKYGDWIPTRERKIVKRAVPDWSSRTPWHEAVEGPESRNPMELALERVERENVSLIAEILYDREFLTGKDWLDDCEDVLSPLGQSLMERIEKEMLRL